MDEKLLTTHSLKQIIDRMYPDMINKDAVNTMLKNLRKQRKISMKEIADLILFIADTSHRQWDIDVLLTGINETNDSINWRGIYEKFLEEDLKIWNTEYLYTLIDCWVHVSGIITVPYEIFFRKWKNRENQIEFFKILLDSDEKRTQVYSNIFFEKIVSKEELKNTKYKKTMEYESNLNSIELFKSIKEIDGFELIEVVKEKSMEYCILGLAAIQPCWEDAFEEILVEFCESTTSHFVYQILFAKYCDRMIQTFKRISEQISLTRTLDIFLEHKMLPVVSEIDDPRDFCFDLIILSSRRDHLNIEVWLNNNFKRLGDAVVNYMFNKLLIFNVTDDANKAEPETRIHTEQIGAQPTLKNDALIFPFNKTIISNLLKVFENKDLSDSSKDKLELIKQTLSDYRMFDKPNSSDKASAFISELINSQMEIEDSLFKIKELMRTDENDFVLAKKIFGLLIDNYSGLHKLPNSETIAVFFGELIKRKIFLKPFLKVAIQLVKNSLKFPESEREYAFALRILEIFFLEYPEILSEIESIDTVRNSLIRKELILVDEDSQAFVCLESLVCEILDIRVNGDILETICKLKIDFDSTTDSLENIYTRIIDSIFNEHGTEDSETSLSSSECLISSSGKTQMEEHRLTVLKNSAALKENHIFHRTTHSYVILFIFKELEAMKMESLVRFVMSQELKFVEFVVETGFGIVKNCFMYKIDTEIDYFKNLGKFLGKLVVGNNRAVNIDVFDFKNFIHKSIEYRRITVCLYFVVNFFKEGTNGITCIPNNPWLLCILDMLSELNSCTLIHIREHIRDLFCHFDVPLICRPSTRIKDHLVKYIIEYEGFQRQIIATALDFSIREVCNKIIKSAITVARTTVLELFNTREELYQDSETSTTRFFLLRNILVNLTKSIVHFTAQEPLKASICGNITHFLKLSSNEMPFEEVSRIATVNLSLCCSLVEKVAITQANELAVVLFNEHLKNMESCVADEMYNGQIKEDNSALIVSSIQSPVKKVKILMESVFAEKANIRPIENSEYQEIRGFLIQMGRKMPLKKKDFIVEEWPNLLKKNGNRTFYKMIESLEGSRDRDGQCLGLCKYLIGHAIKTGCTDNHIFEYISRIFLISGKTMKEVVGWLIYSEDPKRYNIPLICKFIEHDLIYLEEYDQAICRQLKGDDSKAVGFAIELLTTLLASDYKLATVYDFIHTIEMLNKLSDNPKVIEFFRIIESGMLKFSEVVAEMVAFDDFVKNCRLSSAEDLSLSKFREKTKCESLSLCSAFKSCWNHFVLYSSSYRFFKLDLFVNLTRNNIFENIKDSLTFIVQAYSKGNYLFFLFYCRFIVKALDHLETTAETTSFIFKMLAVLSPVNIPGFTVHFIEIINHKFVVKNLDRNEAFFIFRDLLKVLEYDTSHEYSITQFFISNSGILKRFSLYLSYLCPEKCVQLKNLLNQTRTKAPTEQTSNQYFLAFYSLSTSGKIAASPQILVDNLNECNTNTLAVIKSLKNLVEQNNSVREIVLLLLVRSSAADVPGGVKIACSEILDLENARSVAEEYRNRYFNKM